jgi:tetratricopeptide (TPR) repeat protein
LSEFHASGEAFLQAAAHTDAPEKRALLLANASLSFLWNHDYERTLQFESQARELAIASNSDAATAYAVMVRDEHELIHGRGLTDETEIELATAQARRSGDIGVYLRLLTHGCERASWKGEFRRAIECAEKGIAVAEKHRMPGEALVGQWFLGIASTALGDYGRGFGVLSSGLELSDRIGDRAVKARLLNTLGWCHAEFGCHSHAIEYNRMGTDLAREIVDLGLVAGAPELYANASINLAGNLTALGEPEAASDQLAVIQEQYDTDEDPWMRWRWSLHLLDALARVDLVRGEAEAALAKIDLEIAGAREKVVRKIEARALELRGRTLVFMDQREEAEDALRAALEIARQIEHPPVAWRALSLLGEVARRRGQTEITERYFAEVDDLIESKAPSIPRDELRSEFRAMAKQLVTDPLAAYR